MSKVRVDSEKLRHSQNGNVEPQAAGTPMLHIIGTGHHYQFGSSVRFGNYRCSAEDQNAFARLLRDLATSCVADVLAEELNPQALEEVGKTTSVMQLVAAELAIPHLFCEPDRTERAKLGIRDENEIRVSSFPNDLHESVVQSLLAESWRRREQEWLRRLVGARSKNVVFVCGSEHISTFVAFAQQQGVQCKVVDDSWEASS